MLPPERYAETDNSSGLQHKTRQAYDILEQDD